MSTPKYRLSYFNYRGGGEIVRLIFAVGNIEYEDERIEKEAWPDRKAGMPMKSLPVLTVRDGDNEMIYCQSGAIARYLAKKSGLYGSSNEETLLIDEIYDSVGDVRKQFIQIHFETDTNRKKEAGEKLKNQLLPNFNSYIELRKTQFGNGGYLVGDKMTLADLAVFNLVDSSLMMGQEDLWSPYPVLLEHRKQMMGNSDLMKWLNDRPVTNL